MQRKLAQAGCTAPVSQVLRDLERLHAVEVDVAGTWMLARTELEGTAYEAFKALGLRPPHRVQRLEALPV